MKSIKHILSAIILLNAINMIAQYSFTTIYTPHYTQVTVYNFIGTDYTSQQKEDNKIFC